MRYLKTVQVGSVQLLYSIAIRLSGPICRSSLSWNFLWVIKIFMISRLISYVLIPISPFPTDLPHMTRRVPMWCSGDIRSSYWGWALILLEESLINPLRRIFAFTCIQKYFSKTITTYHWWGVSYWCGQLYCIGKLKNYHVQSDPFFFHCLKWEVCVIIHTHVWVPFFIWREPFWVSVSGYPLVDARFWTLLKTLRRNLNVDLFFLEVA